MPTLLQEQSGKWLIKAQPYVQTVVDNFRADLKDRSTCSSKTSPEAVHVMRKFKFICVQCKSDLSGKMLKDMELGQSVGITQSFLSTAVYPHYRIADVCTLAAELQGRRIWVSATD